MATDIDARFAAFCAAYRAETEEICAQLAVHTSRVQAAISSGNPAALRAALRAACNYEYRVMGECELFGGIVEELGVDESGETPDEDEQCQPTTT